MLQSILSELDTTCVSILGDWNADISDDSSIFAGHLRQFCSDTGLLLSDEVNLPSDTFTHVRDSLAKKLAMSDPTKFWSEIRMMSGKSNTLPSCVEGVSGKGRIVEQWRLHFENLFFLERNDMSFNAEYNDDIVVTTEEVVRAVQKLDTGKSSGLDGIFAEHLLHCSERLLSMLAVCITGFFVHGFLPDSMLSTVLVPIIKDKTGRIDRMDNYRPIALASVMSKVVEIILLNRISKLLSTYSNQFGLQQELGTDTCIYILKEIVEKYRSLNGCVFMCFLDASKAFDRVNHSVLFSKLVRRGAPGYIVRLLCYWYDRQAMCVRWGNYISDPFHVNNVKYLGHVITNDMTDDADVMRQRRQLYALGNVLSRRFHIRSIEVKNTLFRSFCTPMYTCQLWWNFSAPSMHKLL